ncbi:MAG: hypothetical protein ACKO37_02085 [Vampirovibrionales bacterium]
MSLLPQTCAVYIAESESITLHGSPYYNLTLVPVEAPTQRMRIRVNPEAFYSNPQVGDLVEVSLLMGQVMGATKTGHLAPKAPATADASSSSSAI